MFCVNLLVVLLGFAMMLQIRSQEVDEVRNYWSCDPEYYDEDWYGYDTSQFCRYTVTPGPVHMPDFKLFPDVSCHPGFEKRKLYFAYKTCERRVHEQTSNEPESTFELYKCQDGCMMYNFFLDHYDRYDFCEYPEANLEDVIYNEKDSEQLKEKAKLNCNEIMDRVFNQEKRKCDSPEAQEVYECVNNAMKC